MSTRLTDEQRALAGAPEHVAFAFALARRMSRRSPHEREEMESAALAGLCDAASRYDPSLGVPFKSFAAPRIMGAVNDAMRANGIKGYRRSGLVAARGETAPRVHSLATPVYSHADDTCRVQCIEDTIENGEGPVGWEIESLDTVLVLSRRLPRRWGAAVREYYTRAGRTMAEIADDMAASESRVSNILSRHSLDALRDNLATHAEKEFGR